MMRLFGERVNSGDYVPTTSDFVTAWKIQRVIQNLHTSVKPLDPHKAPYDRKLAEEGAAAIRALIESGSKEPDDYVEPDPVELAKQLNL